MIQFLGETPLITGDTLATAIGLTEGTSQFSNEPWLHFNDNGRDVYIAKKPFRHSLSWDQLNAVDSIYGNKVVTIGGSHYQVRLMRGGNADHSTISTYYGYNAVEHQGSEWNRYMHLIHSAHVGGNNPNTSNMGALVQYTDEQLHLRSSYGNGAYSWCQEVSGANASLRVTRGHGVTHGSLITSSNTHITNGYRPVLELINL